MYHFVKTFPSLKLRNKNLSHYCLSNYPLFFLFVFGPQLWSIRILDGEQSFLIFVLATLVCFNAMFRVAILKYLMSNKHYYISLLILKKYYVELLGLQEMIAR